MPARFSLKPCDAGLVRELMRATSLPHFVVSVLVSRGINTYDKIKRFLNPSLNDDWGNPIDIEGCEEIAIALKRAITQGKHIVVYGDFDLDGISSVAVLTRAIRALSGYVTPFVPDRFLEGYGITEKSYARLMKIKPDVVCTVDCGIANADEIKRLRDEGVRVFVTDHHEAGDLIPKNVPICNPKYKGSKEDACLAGVGVALKIVQELGSISGFPNMWRSYIDFAMLGTFADMMPLNQQNRALCKSGLERIRTECRPCLRALFDCIGTEHELVTSSNIGFSAIPRLNAAGRMGRSDIALSLLMCDDYEESFKISTELEKLNAKRREIEAELTLLATEEAERIITDSTRILVLAGEGWHEGVKGIVASHLVAKYKMPVLIFTIDDKEAKGSGRTSGNINLFKLIDSASDMLIRYGGHAGAVGLTLEAEKLPYLAERLNENLLSVDISEFEDSIEIDAVVSLDELTLKNVETAEKIGPFGQDNKVPLLLAKNVTEFDGRAVGVSGDHFLCKLSNGNSKIPCINFHCDNIDSLLKSQALVNAVFSVEAETWKGITNVKAKAEAIIPASECPLLSSLSNDKAIEFIDELFTRENLQANSVSTFENTDLEVDRDYYEQLATSNPDELEEQIIQSIIGDSKPHKTQKEILDRLKNGDSTLGIMATGRGKSLIFQVYSAMIALKQNKASLFVYPLRALMADQAYHITNQFKKFGLKCDVLNGATPQEERKRIYQELCDGTTDIILTTPEYLNFHGAEIAKCNRIGFLVVDEAHHIGLAKSGNRGSYLDLNKVVIDLGNPVVLAVTATADDKIARDITDILGLRSAVVDYASRDNLHINDKRNITHKDDYLARIIANGGKTVIYVNSREASISVARRLRMRVPQLAPYVGFYNAGLTRDERTRIEKLFRTGDINILVATSAFGEGIDIPNIRNVVLYHMPFSAVEFNQMAGRAGRDGQDSWIHLLYGKRDAQINENMLINVTPPRDLMVVVYSILNKIQDEVNDSSFEVTIDELLQRIGKIRYKGKVIEITPAIAICGLQVFNELGLIDSVKTFTNGNISYKIKVNKQASKVDLTDSSRYCEGLGEQDSFKAFRKWALIADIDTITAKITHPISPKEKI